MVFVKIAESLAELDFSPEGLALVEVKGKKICIARHGDAVHACNARCPHASGNIAQGYIDVLGNIVCPVHRYKFSLQTGRNSSGEGYFLKTYPLRVEQDGVFIFI